MEGEGGAAAAIRHRTVEANGISMHVAEAGPEDGGGRPAVLFLHGFPELWYSWRHQMAHLASRGYRCVAPDLPRRRRRRRAPRRPRPTQGVRCGSRLGRHHRVVPVPVPAGPRRRAGQHQRRLHVPRLHPRRPRSRQDNRTIPQRVRTDILHLPLPGARGRGEGVRAGARQAPHDPDPLQPLQRAQGGRRRASAAARRRPAPGLARRGRHRLLRRRLREDRLHRRHQLLPQHGQELGAGGAVGGRQGERADQVHRGGRGPDVPLRGDPGLPAQGRVQGGRAAAGGAGRHPRRRTLHPAGEGAGGQRPHLQLHRQVLNLPIRPRPLNYNHRFDLFCTA